MKFLSCAFVAILFLLLLDYCSSPSSQQEKKQAIIAITVDRVPILVEWDYYAKLWCIQPIVVVAETNGVGVNVTKAQFEFIYNSKAYEPQEYPGARLNAFARREFYLHICTEYLYDKVRFTVIGTDDNGHSINVRKEFDLHYIDLGTNAHVRLRED